MEILNDCKLKADSEKNLYTDVKLNTMKNLTKTTILTESNSKQMLKKASSDIKLLDMNEEIKNIRILKAAWQDNGEAKDGNKHLKHDIEIKESLEDMRLHINAEELIRQLKRYEMNSILTEYEKTLKLSKYKENT